MQNVAVTGSIYESGNGNKTEYYFTNQTKIVILKQNQETKQPLEGVKFQLLDENKQVIYTDLTTNKEGIITIENLLPGKYYIQEVETLENYEVYDKYTVIPEDVSCTSQNTDGRTEITLITCTDDSSQRVIVKARAI